MEYKYNYVIFNSPDNKLRVDNDGYYTICTKDLENLEQARVVSYPLDKHLYWIR